MWYKYCLHDVLEISIASPYQVFELASNYTHLVTQANLLGVIFFYSAL